MLTTINPHHHTPLSIRLDVTCHKYKLQTNENTYEFAASRRTKPNKKKLHCIPCHCHTFLLSTSKKVMYLKNSLSNIIPSLSVRNRSASPHVGATSPRSLKWCTDYDETYVSRFPSCIRPHSFGFYFGTAFAYLLPFLLLLLLFVWKEHKALLTA